MLSRTISTTGSTQIDFYTARRDRQVARTKASHAKVRTGCVKCKQRRVKCDETKPACLRCVKIGEHCPGYQNQIKIFGLNVNEGFTSPFEKICFDSFFSGGSGRLALFQPSTKQFWLSLLPQLCQIYLPLRHGVIALSLINEPFFQPDLMKAVATESHPDILSGVIAHFNKSISIFASELPRLSIEAKLSCCFVFTALTIFLYRVGASSTHLGAAYNFMKLYDQQIQDGKAMADSTLKGTLLPIMRRLFIDACTFSDALIRAPLNPYEAWLDEVLTVPAEFTDVESAYESMGNLLKYAIALSLGHIQSGSDAVVQLRIQMSRFRIALHKRPPTLYSGHELSKARVAFHFKDLMIHHRAAQILAVCGPHTLEHSLWACTADFQFVLQQLSELVDIEPANPWRVSLCWIPPLFLVATRCRVTKLRRQALIKLHSLKRVERGWSSCVAHAIAKFVVDQEEAINEADQLVTSFTYLRLISINLEPEKDLATVTCAKQVNEIRIGITTTTFPLRSEPNLVPGAPTTNLPDPVLQASGYDGTLLFCPSMECHCLRKPAPLDNTDNITESGSVDELMAWQSATFSRSALEVVGRPIRSTASCDAAGEFAEQSTPWQGSESSTV